MTVHGADSVPPTTTFAQRLNRLFATVYPPGRGPYTSYEVVHALQRGGVRLSSPYMSQLRNGARHNPSKRVVEAIADFFGIEPGYLTATDPHYSAKLDEELTWLEIGRDGDARRLTTLLLQLPPSVRLQLLDQISASDPSAANAHHTELPHR